MFRDTHTHVSVRTSKEKEAMNLKKSNTGYIGESEKKIRERRSDYYYLKKNFNVQSF